MNESTNKLLVVLPSRGSKNLMHIDIIDSGDVLKTIKNPSQILECRLITGTLLMSMSCVEKTST